MKEHTQEDLEIQRMRQLLTQGIDETDVDNGTIKMENDLRIVKINERGEIFPLGLWSPEYIRTMTSFTYDFDDFFYGKKRLVANRVSDNQIIVEYESNIDSNTGSISDISNKKNIIISENEWNLLISYLFNYVKIDLWDNHISCYSRKAYGPNGSDYRQVPVCDGYSWHLTVCGERRTHEFSGVCRVHGNWPDFSRLICALEEKVKEPSVDLLKYLAAEMYAEKH